MNIVTFQPLQQSLFTSGLSFVNSKYISATNLHLCFAELRPHLVLILALLPPYLVLQLQVRTSSHSLLLLKVRVRVWAWVWVWVYSLHIR